MLLASHSTPRHLEWQAETRPRLRSRIAWWDDVAYLTESRNLTFTYRVQGALDYASVPDTSGWGASARVGVGAGGSGAIYQISSTAGYPVYQEGWESFSYDAQTEMFEGTFSDTLFVDATDPFGTNIFAWLYAEGGATGRYGDPFVYTFVSDMTMWLESVTVADSGLTPEAEGLVLSFDSGLPSPNTLPIPEPSTLALLAVGLIGIGGYVSRNRIFPA